MSEPFEAHPEAPPPSAQIVQMAMGHWISNIVHVAARLGLADHLANGPMSADDLAGPTGTHAPSLFRLMRTLASLGILAEAGHRRFGLDAARRGAADRGSRVGPRCGPDSRQSLVDARGLASCSIPSKPVRADSKRRWARRSSTGSQRIRRSPRCSARP